MGRASAFCKRQGGVLWLVGALLAAAGPAAAARPEVDLIRVEGLISPAAAMYVQRAIDGAREAGAEALVIEIDTPGGLVKSMDLITRALLQSPVPVIVYVAPLGARAASAGLFVVYASHVAAMAPATHLGASTPVFAGGDSGAPGESENQRILLHKAMEDAVAQIRAIAARRGRNADWGEQAVRQGAAIPAEEAVRLKVVDLLARDTNDLLRRIDGRAVQLPEGTRILRTAGAAIVPVGMDLRERLLGDLAEPELGLILAAIAMLGIIYELSSPGSILPGIIGGIALILALMSFAMLDVNYAGVALIGFAALLFITELFVPTYGILSAGGVISFILGALLLTSSDELLGVRRASPLLIFPMAMSMGAFFFFVAGSALRAQRRKPFAGQESLVGEPGVARTDLKPRGMVLVQGELWAAEALDGAVEMGQQVRVVAAEGLKLRVRREKHE